MAQSPRTGHRYTDINIAGSSRSHLGDIHNHGQSEDEQTLRCILESLEYVEMKHRIQSVNNAEPETLQWLYYDGELVVRTTRKSLDDTLFDRGTETVDMKFKGWVQGAEESMFCFMGLPGAGKSTLM